MLQLSPFTEKRNFEEELDRVYNKFADFGQKIWKCQIIPLSLHPKHQEQSSQDGLANFNREVGSRAGTATRLAFNLVNIEELKRRGIDVSAVYDGTIIKFAHHVQLDDTGTKLVLTED